MANQSKLKEDPEQDEEKSVWTSAHTATFALMYLAYACGMGTPPLPKPSSMLSLLMLLLLAPLSPQKKTPQNAPGGGGGNYRCFSFLAFWGPDLRGGLPAPPQRETVNGN